MEKNMFGIGNGGLPFMKRESVYHQFYSALVTPLEEKISLLQTLQPSASTRPRWVTNRCPGTRDTSKIPSYTPFGWSMRNYWCYMDSMNLRPIEQAKISCAKKLFNEMSTSNVKYHDVDSYQNLLNIMASL